MLYALCLLPIAGALVSWIITNDRFRPYILPFVALPHLAMTFFMSINPPPPSAKGWIWLDPLGAIVLICISLLFAVCSIYSVGYLSYRRERPNKILCICLLICLSAMTIVTMSQHLGLFWVAIETTTVTMTPLIYYNRNARSIEATWKYLLICSVGIALAFLGLMFLAYSTHVAHKDATLLMGPLMASAAGLNKGWLHASFIFLLVGYGCKMGLAPLHVWKPDAYGEAPGLVGALLAGGLVNCAFLAIIRIYQVCIASASETVFFQNALIGMGLGSMAVAAVFMTKQTDFKRMLAYSSVEHVGILAVGLGLGKAAAFATLFHLINNGLTKGVLFLSAGNLHRSYSSKNISVVRGGMTRLPWSAWLFMAGFIAITGSPPFSPFISEFGIVSSSFIHGHYIIGSMFILFLAVIFIGMANIVIPMVMGKPPQEIETTKYRDRFLTVAPPLFMMFVIFLLGVWQPSFLTRLLNEGAELLKVNP